MIASQCRLSGTSIHMAQDSLLVWKFQPLHRKMYIYVSNIIEQADDIFELRIVAYVKGELTLPFFCSFLFLLDESNVIGVHGGWFY
jgi:hypothetical protein